MDPEKRDKHVFKLWRRAYLRAFSCGIIIMQFHSINTKLCYFGRQVIGQTMSLTIEKERKNRIQNAMQNPKWIPFLLYPEDFFKRHWDHFMIIMLLYTVTLEPFTIAFYRVNDRL